MLLPLHPPSPRSDKPASGITNISAVASGSGRIAVEPMAPAEAFPRSFNPAPAPTPLRTGRPTPKGAAAPAGALPSTPTGSPGGSACSASEAFETPRSGSDAFATPRSMLESEVSFRSARSGAGAPGARGGGAAAAAPASVAGSFVSVRSAGSRRTSAASASRAESAAEHPQAFVPGAGALSDASSDEGSAGRLPTVAAAGGSGRSRLSGFGARARGSGRGSQP
jgi:hypothetical protein